MKKRFKKFLISWLFSGKPPDVVEKQTEVHHHHHHYPSGREVPENYGDGMKNARQAGSELIPVKELSGLWV